MTTADISQQRPGPKSTAGFLEIAVGILAVILPLEFLLDVNNVFYVDWINHVWFSSYYAEFFRNHHNFPELIHTARIVGLVNSIFYGHLFYLAAGFLGSFAGPDIGIRIVLFAAAGGQFYWVYDVVHRFSLNRRFALALAVLVTWAIYPLTNLYNRSALTEFVSVCLLTISICALLRTITLENRRNQCESVALSGLFFTLCAMTHPITGVLGGLVIVAVFAIMLWRVGAVRKLWWACLGTGLLSLSVFSPWLLVLKMFSSDLPINQPGMLGIYPFESFLSRISLFPFDRRSLFESPAVTSTPFLEAQINMALLILLVGIWWAFRPSGATADFDKSKSPLFASSLAPAFGSSLMMFAGLASLYFLGASLGWFPDLVPDLLKKSQFGYRMITGVNIGFLLMAIAATQVSAGKYYRRDRLMIVVTVSMTLALTGVLIKLSHVEGIRHRLGPWQTAAQRSTLPSTMYNLGAYNVMGDMGRYLKSPGIPEQKVVFTPAMDRGFGDIPEVDLMLDRPTVIETNVYAFPWNKVLVDGVEVPQQYFFVDMDGYDAGFSSVLLPSGSHRLGYRFTPSREWRSLRAVSVWVLGLWTLVHLGMKAVTSRRKLPLI